jgi:polysaccharide export outer membrane protein
MIRSFSSVIAVFTACAFLCAAGAYPAENSEYKLHSTDVVIITVYGQPDLATKTRISTDGYITFPLLGKVLAEGLTVQEFEQKIKTLLEKDYLVSAQVVVFIDAYHTRQVSVIGEVNNPGKYDMRGEKEMMLMQAIAMAGGFTKHADITKVRVMRFEKGEKKTILINAKDITEKGNKDKDIMLKPDDVIYVSESFF